MIPTSNTGANLILQKELGRRIRAVRKEKGFSQSVLAKSCGLHVSHLSKIERGGANATVSSLLAIAEVLQIELAKLFREL